MKATEASVRYPAPAQDQVLHLARHLHDGQSRLLLTFSGRLDAERLTRAFELSLDAEPVMGCRFVAHPWRPYWERLSDGKKAAALSIVERSDDDAINTWMGGSLDSSTDAQVRVCLFRGAGDRLAVNVSHESADGTGSRDYLILLAAIYRELRTNPAYIPRPAPGRRLEQREVFRHVGLRRLLRGCLHFSFPGPGVDFPAEGPGVPAFASRRVGPEGFARIRGYCREHGVTVNEVLTAAFYRSQFRVLSSPPAARLTVPIPINLRQYLPAGSTWSICNLSGVFFGGVRNQSFDRMILDVRRLMASARSNEPWLGQAVVLELMFLLPHALLQPLFRRSISRQIASGKVYPYITNHGIIDTAPFDFGDAPLCDFDTWSPVPRHPLPVFSAYSVFDTLRLTVTTRDQPNGSKAERLLDAYFQELPGHVPPAAKAVRR
ncbi:MAG: acyltransferase PapA5 [Syntrophorhabdaceae bacterium PtaU1.Bin034]|nr:MAG: acyltransferase PapA5 [Syntrophorhabdaceae bacterium PtaU1.Bin034]